MSEKVKVHLLKSSNFDREHEFIIWKFSLNRILLPTILGQITIHHAGKCEKLTCWASGGGK